MKKDPVGIANRAVGRDENVFEKVFENVFWDDKKRAAVQEKDYS
jgi:hypothetical protein